MKTSKNGPLPIITLFIITNLDSSTFSSEYSGVAEPGIPPNRATLIPVAKARVSTTESHMKRGNFEHMCG